ncbi:MAG: hypothetical protein EBT77_00610 [Verrucomicrobia bacterium]|nr:hypothetical protein [Verrucomicrobiota bacterium]
MWRGSANWDGGRPSPLRRAWPQPTNGFCGTRPKPGTDNPSGKTFHKKVAEIPRFADRFVMAEFLLLQHEPTEGPGTIAEEILGAGHGIRTVRIDQKEKIPEDPGPYLGLVVMGGNMGVYDQGRLPHLRQEISLLERAVKADKAILGVCLGAQLLAAAAGAEVKPGEKEIGWIPVHKMPDACKDPVLRRLPEKFQALMWHGDHFSWFPIWR